MRLRLPSKYSVGLMLLLAGIFGVHLSEAATRVEELQSSIGAKTTEIGKLEQEIRELDQKLRETSGARQTLAGAIKELETTIKKLDTDIKVTEGKIDITELNLEKLAIEIGSRTQEIAANKLSLAEIIRQIDEGEKVSFFEGLLSESKLTEVIDNIEELDRLQNDIYEKVQEVKEIKSVLEVDHAEVANQKRQLVSLKVKLADQKKIADGNRASQQKLLKETQNKESNYKKILADKLAKKEAFERELIAFQSQLKREIDASRLPSPGTSSLAWPVDAPYVTQQFGDTAFSRQHAGVYSGRGHNGIDLRASLGSPIRASRLGTVVGTGDTDLVCNGASYGKWVLIRHDNGLSTLYAHLSLIKVSEGQTVSTRELVGYSGNTGYSTGPHLHFTVYATQGVEVSNLKSKNPGCGTYRLPIASLNAYLNPLLYLPAH